METYSYPPLALGHIRLLSLSTTKDDELCASIKDVPFDKDDPPVYSALSYVWGTGDFTIPLNCDGAVLHITPTLEEALRQTIKLDHSEALWVDQICINQQNFEERSQQVKMMNSIFKCAGKVLAYLGASTPSTPLAVDLITRVGTIAKGMSGDMFLWDREQYDEESLKKYEEISNEESEKLGIPFSEIDSWDAFSEFFNRPWYERIWIVQEMLPSRNALVICGDYSVPWDLVKGAATWHHHKAGAIAKRHRRSINGIELTAGMELTWNIRMGTEYLADLFGQKTTPVYRWELQRLLTTFRRRKATDPHDKVYALLGLSDLDFDVESGKFEVDYSKDVKAVFTYTTRAIINRAALSRSNLDILLQGRRSTCTCEDDATPPSDDWPSWVPDWRRHMGVGCEWGVGQHFDKWHDEHAAGTHVDEKEEGADPFALRARGTIIGRVVHLSQYHHFSQIIQHGRLREARDMFVGIVSSYPTGQDLDIVFALTMLGGTVPQNILDKGTTIQQYTDNYLGFLDSLMMPQNTSEEARTRQLKASWYHHTFGFDNNWLQAVLKAYCERRWYVLDTGYVGLGNHNMHEGDVVAKLVGLSVPCVLRPLETGDGYRFIG
ncbi:hypothetical protein N0V88_006592 [Collariella sp. IMI 366227]|nr:hypothetical protein N0V88_006592 [Collariella sp. IMI 366227]